MTFDRGQDGFLSIVFLAATFLFGATGCNPSGLDPQGGAGPTQSPSGSPSTEDPTAVRPPRPSNGGNESICAGQSVVNGTDVSHHQVNTQWGEVAHTGAGFAFIKATEGLTYMNPNFSVDWPEVSRHGMIRGAYHFFRPEDDPIEQADYYLTTVGNFSELDLPPMLDWEVSDGVATSRTVKNALIWLKRVRDATGKTPIVYIDPTYFNSIQNPESLSGFPLFIADFGVACPNVPPPWSKWAFWQKAENGLLNGITGDVDLDLFNGSHESLKLFAKTGVY